MKYYNICGSVVDEASYAGVKAAIDSFGIAGESSLKAAAQDSLLTVQTEALREVQMVPLTEHRVQVLILPPQVMEAVMEQSQTPADLPGAAYRYQPDQNYLPNSDGHPLVITRMEMETGLTLMEIPIVL